VTEAAARPRLPAEERRAAVLDTACRVFSRGTYHGTTTAEIARAAGVSEPILYRHFPSKRDLYLACVEEMFRRTKGRWEEALREESDPAEWLAAMGRAFHEWKEQRALVSSLWLQSLAEASEDPKIRAHVRDHLRKVHAFVADIVRRSQAEGGIDRERDANAEAWIFLGVGLIAAAGLRLGGLLEDDLGKIRDSRRRWLTGGS
jgi:TetR/AcrR family transcriptional regulator